MILPEDYLIRIKAMLGEEFSEFLKFYDNKPFRGVRVNLLKCSVDKFIELFHYGLEKSAFSKDTFYINHDISGIGNLPLYHAGAFYVQEPSATTAVMALDPKPGEKILDLCAAPGGKSTQIASYMRGRGLLWSNEIIPNRAKILLSNMERMGVKNAVISCSHPKVLSDKLVNFFDKILVDAPCSGEGMFRKDPGAINHWSVEHVKMCSVRQLEVLQTAAKMVKENGIIVYSTCTFSLEENEFVIDKFLKTHDNFKLDKIECDFGRSGYCGYCSFDMTCTRRVFPQDGGEGHFVAKLRCIKKGSNEVLSYKHNNDNKKLDSFVYAFLDSIYKTKPEGVLQNFGDKLMLLPEGMPDIAGLGAMRAGLLLGEYKKGRIEPAHALFMASKIEELRNVLNLSSNSADIDLFLHGEEINVPENLSGFVGVAVDSIITGFGKCSSGRLKNKYPKGLRIKG